MGDTKTFFIVGIDKRLVVFIKGDKNIRQECLIY